MFRSNTLRAAVALALCVPGAAIAQSPSISDPAKLFAREPEFINPQISPTGEFIAVDTPDGERRALSMIKLGGEGERKLFRFDGNEDRWHNVIKKEPYGVNWTDDNRLIVFEGYDYGRFGNKNSSGNVYAINGDASEPKQLFGYVNDAYTTRGRFKDEGTPFLMDVLPELKGQALFYFMPWSTGSNQFTTSVYAVDSYTGTRKQIESFSHTGSVSVAADNAGKPRVNIRWDLQDKQIVQYRPTPGSDWVAMPAALAGQAFGLWFFDPDNNTAYAEISDKGEAAQLYRINFSAGTRERIAGQPNQEITGIERAGRLGPPVVLRYSAGKPKIDYLDPKSPWTQLHSGLMKAFPGSLISFEGITRDDNKVLFKTYSDRDPGTYYLFDRKTNTPSMLFKSREWIDPAQMSPTMPIEFKNRDGVSLNAFLTIPQGKPGPQPLIVMPHGGPFGISDSWSFDDDTQFLASLGYAVLRVNYRGSGLRGDDFEVSGYKKWGTGIQDDIADGVKHVIAQGLADASKVCIYGASFGGYSAMMNPIRNPGMYKCAIGYAGVYDLQDLYSDRDGSKRGASFFSRTMGDSETQAAQSPVAQIAKLDVPILLIHGKADHTAPFDQFQTAEAALKKNGKTYETLVKPDEGHGFYRANNQEEAYNKMKAFLLKYNPPN